MNKLFNMNLIYWVIFVSLFVSALGESKILSCRQLEKNYSKCQLKHYWYGRVSRPTQNFRLTNTDVEIHREKDSDGDYHTYHTLVLYEKNRPIKFYKHSKLKFLNNHAYSDKKRIDSFLLEGNEKETLEIRNNSYIDISKHIIELIIMLIISMIFFLIFAKLKSKLR